MHKTIVMEIQLDMFHSNQKEWTIIKWWLNPKYYPHYITHIHYKLAMSESEEVHLRIFSDNLRIYLLYLNHV